MAKVDHLVEERCPKCKEGVLRQKVTITVNAPPRCRNLSKSGLRHPYVFIESADWPNAVIFCTHCPYKE